MTEILPIVYPALFAGVVFTGMHAYLGVHAVERGVIFAGLALAQLAALGTTIAVRQGFDPHAPISYSWSFGLTVIGAAIFAMTRTHRDAIIGIVYAVSAAAAIIVMSMTTGGFEHLKGMLVGNILSVRLRTVIKTASLYAAVGLFHFIVRKKCDFLFYASLAVVVTSSVAIAGVLPVFLYLIAPSVAAMLFARTIGKRLAIGWTMGALVSALGVLLSVKLDLPTGATIVCTFGITLALMAAVWAVFVRPKLITQ